MEDMNARLDRIIGEVTAAEAAGGMPDKPPGGTTPDPPPANATAGLLAGGLANPALLAALPTLLENLAPGGKGAAPPDRHTALLCAIKPYLGPDRQAAADTVLRLVRVWDALARSGISLSSLFGSLTPPEKEDT